MSIRSRRWTWTLNCKNGEYPPLPDADGDLTFIIAGR